VVGAGVGSLMVLMSKEFFALVLTGMLIAFPIAWYSTDVWTRSSRGSWVVFPPWHRLPVRRIRRGNQMVTPIRWS